MKWTRRNRVVFAFAVSSLMVLLIAAIFPRVYLANDDIGFTEYLRKNTFTPWISQFLCRSFSFAYEQAPEIPWYGLYQYALIIATGTVLIHTCIELIDPRPGLGRIATIVGAVLLSASHAILVIGITWTTVSISALGTALAALVAHAQLCEAAGTRMSLPRSLLYGLLFVNGYMLRLQGLGAVAVALAPIVVWATWRFARKCYLPRPAALFVFAAPFVLVFTIQSHIPNPVNDDVSWFNTFNNERGRIHGHAAFERLDTRAPQLLALAGWGVEEYRDFTNWLIIDENDYPIDKIERLLATGGMPEQVTLAWSVSALRAVFDDVPASLTLLAALVAVCVALTSSRVLGRRSLAFSCGYALFLAAVTLFMASTFRFPQRVSLSFYLVAALGVYVYLARAVAERPPDVGPMTRGRRIAAMVVGLFVLAWAWQLVGWLRRDPPPYREELQALEDRVAARGGFVFVYVQAGLVEFDPLRAQPRKYDGLEGGWGTFSPAWYETIGRLGVHRGSDVLAAMVDNPASYLLAAVGARDALEEWLKRKLHNPSARLALVDRAAILGWGRPELYRVVTTPFVRGSEEANMREADERAEANAIAERLPKPPSVANLEFRSIELQPTARLALQRTTSTRVDVEPIDHGVRCTIGGDATNACTPTSDGDDDDDGFGYGGGVHVAVNGLRAARFELQLVDPENIVSFNVSARTATSRSIRWRWPFDHYSRHFTYTGPLTLVPGSRDRYVAVVANTARPADVRDLEISIVVTPGTHAGFELRNLEVAQP